MRALCLAAVLFSLSATVAAQSPVVIPVDVEAVVTGGFWKTATSQGSYRIVIQTAGFEHAVSQLQVDWIAEPEGNDKSARVVASKIAETGAWRLDSPRIVKATKGWRALVNGIETHTTPMPRGTWILQLGEPGSLKASLKQR
jgi:hypothetical protein